MAANAAFAIGMIVVLCACGARSVPARESAPPASKLSVVEPVPAIDTDAGAPAPVAPVVEVKADSILIIGDSHAFGPFGRTLHERFAKVGPHVVFEAACGATTETFLVPYPEVVCGYRVLETKNGESVPRAVVSTWQTSRIHSLDDMMKKYVPDVVIVVLGTNYPRAPVADSTETFMKRLCRNRTCPRVFWVGPPSFGAQAAASTYISKSIKGALENWKGATFIDSTVFNETKPLPLRKPHFGDDDSRRWADFAFSKIAPELTPH